MIRESLGRVHGQRSGCSSHELDIYGSVRPTVWAISNTKFVIAKCKIRGYD